MSLDHQDGPYRLGHAVSVFVRLRALPQLSPEEHPFPLIIALRRQFVQRVVRQRRQPSRHLLHSHRSDTAKHHISSQSQNTRVKHHRSRPIDRSNRYHRVSFPQNSSRSIRRKHGCSADWVDHLPRTVADNPGVEHPDVLKNNSLHPNPAVDQDACASDIDCDMGVPFLRPRAIVQELPCAG
eukprot:1767334-Rhodomonas_salina.1